MRPLYAIAVEYYDRKGKLKTANVVYLHADSAVHASNQYKTAHPNRNTHVIVSVGLAIGFFTEDKSGKDESVLIA
jgi:hypothetical protein